MQEFTPRAPAACGTGDLVQPVRSPVRRAAAASSRNQATFGCAWSKLPGQSELSGPSSARTTAGAFCSPSTVTTSDLALMTDGTVRSEERRVGKECRDRGGGHE